MKEDMQEKVDIIVPVYNVAKYLDRFLVSLLNQTYQSFRVWIVNDRSTDDSLKVIKKYVSIYPDKIVLLDNKRNLGLCGARNVGLNASEKNGNGEYILLLDSDDYIENTYLEKMVNAADRTGADITICGLDRFDDQTGKTVCIEMVHNPQGLISDIHNFKLLGYMNPVVWNKLFRKKAVANIRFTTIKRSEDTIFLFDVLQNVHSIKFINEVLYHYRLRDSSLSGSITNEIYESMLKGFAKTYKRYIEQKVNKGLIDLFIVQMFIRCGIGGASRLSMQNMKNTRYYVNRTRKYMDTFFPEWRDNKYLNLHPFQKRTLGEIGVSIASILYKMHLFNLFIYVYWFLSKKLKIDYRA